MQRRLHTSKLASRAHAIAISHGSAALLALAACLWPASAFAFYLPLIFSPSAPSAGQPITMTVRVGECDAVQIFAPGQREISVVGSVVRVTIRGYTAFDQNFCIYPDVSVPVDLVPLAAGTYRIELYRRETGAVGQGDLMVSGDLVVGQAPAVAVPALRSLLGLILLTLGLLAVPRGRPRIRHRRA